MKHLSTINFVVLVFVLISFSSAQIKQINWTKHQDPVLTPGPAGEWDAQRLGLSSVLFDGSSYRMWYSIGNPKNIGLATSTDGIIWDKYDDPSTLNPPFAEIDPVLNPGTAGSWDDDCVAYPCVILIDTVYHMWYTGADNPDPNAGAIGHATSTDGVTWEKYENNPVLDVGPPGSWDDEWVWDPWVLFDDSIYHMWYHAWNGIGNQVQIGHATSPHPDSAWTKDPTNPVLSYENGKWDYPRVQAPCVIYDGNIFHMWYSGGQTGEYRIGYATSQDGSQWTKPEADPVLEVGSAGNWDDTMVGFCSVIDSAGSMFKMWYTGANSAGDVAVGYAFAFGPPTAIEEIAYGVYPDGFVLKQNYPNPFNPVTMINYQLPMTGTVELSIYNLLGQMVAMLVNKKQPAGSYEVEWDASGFSSGVYLYRLSARNFVHTKKLILLK